MERYGGSGEEGSRSDPSLEWTGSGTETASMWRLGLRGGGSGGESYPERPDEPDCIYYLRTGACGYGSRCRFNHPRNRGAPVLGGFRTEAGEFPERMGQPACQHFMRTGTCKFGATCKYHHPRGGASLIPPIPLNYMGFPLRPGEKECPYYMRTGQCKFNSTCRFNHPVPPSVQPPPHQQQQLSAGPSIYPSVQSQTVPSSQQYGVVLAARPQLLPGSYVQSHYGYSQMVLPHGMVPYSGWNTYQAIPSPGTQPSIGSNSVYGGITSLSPSAPAYQSGPSSTGVSKEQTYPQRPGQPECQYFMRTGDCKFGSTCRFHHPIDAESSKAITLSNIGLPLRPGEVHCAHFVQHGVCKFGPACKYDHSPSSSSALSYIPSASSITDMPVVPYPLGSSSLSTLAPSSSSYSDQRIELLSSSSIQLKTTTSNGGSETVASVVSSLTSNVSHPESVQTKKDELVSIEAKTST